MAEQIEKFDQVFLPRDDVAESTEKQNPIGVTFHKKVNQRFAFGQFAEKYLDVAFKTSDQQVLPANKVILALHSKVIYK